ncbi:MAG: helix-turn-helix domain-containing protein [Clostridia bacterium]|nr:helix-turn-helix domain-containing protein [Clostridia bacterium]
MGKRIKELRTEGELSQKDLAERVGVAQNTIAQYEKGTAKPSLDVLVKLAVTFNTTTDDVLGIID